MSAFTILAGGYDSSIAAYAFTPDNASLTLVNTYPSGQNPSWISLNPSNTSVLYATNENTEGGLQSFIIGSDFSLSAAVDTVASGGDAPAYATWLSTGEVAVMNYNSGDGRILPTSSPETFTDDAPLLTFPVLKNISHPHMVYEYEDEVLVTDLGGDVIWRLKQQSAGNYEIQGQIAQPDGSGPRHIQIVDDYLYTLHELASTLTVQQMPAAPNGTSDIISDVSIIPDDAPEGSAWGAAEILIPATTDAFPTQYIYVSNRNIGNVTDPRGDTVAIFEHVNKGEDGEELKLINQFYTGISQVRGMEFSPDGAEYLVAAGVVGEAGTIVFRRTENGTNFEKVAANLEIPTRTSFVWLQ
ncbi:putative isomerase YbhE [Schizophyllum commune H4-8]|uniref:Isomerase YbhE n=1 Tax=Schizophyllum commune (strain H4-8 / FGSC 9210) TaxID=578458 RepID=D8QLX5_SCHCM|nr:putative isomerase YbhE [Schizophyllum commune H4-8]KAI5886632.1 putative isomerase YbhE [Schizophyllum commune H4-8]